MPLFLIGSISRSILILCLFAICGYSLVPHPFLWNWHYHNYVLTKLYAKYIYSDPSLTRIFLVRFSSRPNIPINDWIFSLLKSCMKWPPILFISYRHDNGSLMKSSKQFNLQSGFTTKNAYIFGTVVATTAFWIYCVVIKTAPHWRLMMYYVYFWWGDHHHRLLIPVQHHCQSLSLWFLFIVVTKTNQLLLTEYIFS